MLARIASRGCFTSRPVALRAAPSVLRCRTGALSQRAFLRQMTPRTRSRFFTSLGLSQPQTDAARGDSEAAAPSTPAAAAAALLDGVTEDAKAMRLLKQLGQLYPNPPIPLDHKSTFQLLVAVILSAQSTDKKVNQITPMLFKMAPDAEAMAGLEVEVIQEAIKQIGLSKTKASNLSKTAKMLMEHHAGEVPSTFKELEALAGVGHKTASVVMAQAFGHASFPVDTHIHRLAQRWGLTCGKNVEKTEADLKAAFPESTWNDLHLQIIYFGREHCAAQRHDPTVCLICSWAAVPPYDQPGASPLKPGQSPGGQTPSKKRAKASGSSGSISGRGRNVKKAIEDAGSPSVKAAAKRNTKDVPGGNLSSAQIIANGKDRKRPRIDSVKR